MVGELESLLSPPQRPNSRARAMQDAAPFSGSLRVRVKIPQTDTEMESSTDPEAVHATLLEVVQSVQESVHSDAEVVAVVANLINTGRVVLTGSFSGTRCIRL